MVDFRFLKNLSVLNHNDALEDLAMVWGLTLPDIATLLLGHICMTALEAFTDETAERGVALDTIQIASKKSLLPAYPLEIASGQKHVTGLSNAVATFGATTRAAIDAVAKAGDADIADLFTEISHGVDKLLWQVEAHAESKD